MLSKQNLKKYFFILLLANFFLGYAGAAYAQTTQYDYSKSGVGAQIKTYLCAPTEGSEGTWFKPGGVSGTEAANNAASNDLYLCINKLYKFAIAIASSVGVLMIVAAGYMYMSSDGNQESVDKAKGMVVSTIAALVILFAGYIILRTINPDLITFRNIQPRSVRLELMACPGGSARNAEGLCVLPDGTRVPPIVTTGTTVSTQRYVIAGIDIGPYATDPNHEMKITDIYNSLRNLNMASADVITQYMVSRSKTPPGTPLTGQMVLNAAQQYNVDPRLLLAIMQNDSRFGSDGLGARTHNPGNVGNDDTGRTRDWGTWQAGVNAVAEWLSRHRST